MFLFVGRMIVMKNIMMIADSLKVLKDKGVDFRMVVLPDHPTPICVRTHTSDPVPYMLYDSTDEKNESWNYNEKDAEASGNFLDEGYKMMEKLLSK